MILTCPACSAKYMVASDTIGKDGRKVRCAKCKHEWVQKSEQDSLDELIARIQSVEMDDIAFEEMAVKAAPSKLQGLWANITGSINHKKATLKFWLDRKILNLKSRTRKYIIFFKPDRKTAAGAVLAILVFAILGGITISAHNKISDLYPATLPYFEKIGIHYDQETIDYNPEQDLAFDRLEMISDSHTDKISGMLINLTPNIINVPSIKVVIVDGDGKPLLEKIETLKNSEIEGEGLIDFVIDLDKKAPKTAVKLALSFSENLPKEQKHQPLAKDNKKATDDLNGHEEKHSEKAENASAKHH